MRTIGKAALASCFALAQDQAPYEACGVLLGPVGDPEAITGVLVATNHAEHPEARFAMDPAEQLALFEAVHLAGQRVRAIWHSHVRHGATLSATDVRYMLDVNMPWLVVSLSDSDARLWRTTVPGNPVGVVEETFEIVA